MLILQSMYDAYEHSSAETLSPHEGYILVALTTIGKQLVSRTTAQFATPYTRGRGRLVNSQFDDALETMFQSCAERHFEHVPLILHSSFQQS